MLEDDATVLDSGCGPASWTFEMGETFPKSKLYGVDFSTAFPKP
jgi:trans-aconitate methyltransferase